MFLKKKVYKKATYFCFDPESSCSTILYCFRVAPQFSICLPVRRKKNQKQKHLFKLKFDFK